LRNFIAARVEAKRRAREEALRKRDQEMSAQWWLERIGQQSESAPRQPNKCFGERRDYKSVYGWGHWRGDEWIPLSDPEFTGEHPTIAFSRSLNRSSVAISKDL
jgi:hypothetical protein